MSEWMESQAVWKNFFSWNLVTWFQKAEDEKSRSDFPFPSESSSVSWRRMLGLPSGWNYNRDEHVLIFLEQQGQMVVTKWCILVPKRWEILILYFQWRIVRWRRMLGLPSGWEKTGGLLTHIGTAQPSPRPEFLILCMFKLFESKVWYSIHNSTSSTLLSLHQRWQLLGHLKSCQ